MKKYKIHFEQVNQTNFDITAKNPRNALRAAIQDWKREIVVPDWRIEDEDGEEVNVFNY